MQTRLNVGAGAGMYQPNLYEPLQADPNEGLGPCARCCRSSVCKICSCCLVCYLVLAVLLGAIAGYAMTKLCYAPFTGIDKVLQGAKLICQQGQIAPQLSYCDDMEEKDGGFCGLGQGYRFAGRNITESLPVWTATCASDELVQAVKMFGSKHPDQLVHFTSRPGGEGQELVHMTALWMPVKDPQAPRIVMMHGNNVDFNDNTVQIPAYMLRQMGFAVLLPNHRWHGTTRHAGRSVAWGYDLHLDVLGAWDYALTDPDGVLGGELPANKVGLYGVSMGGFSSEIAFGLDTRIPGLWLDSPATDPEEVLAFGIKRTIPFPPLSYLAAFFSWKFASVFGKGDVGLYAPMEVLAKSDDQICAKPRPVAVVHGESDFMVPVQQSRDLVALLRDNAECYEVAFERITDYVCGTKAFPFPVHGQMHTWQPNSYRTSMCDFYTHALDLPEDFCQTKTMPLFPQCTEAVCLKPPSEARLP